MLILIGKSKYTRPTVQCRSLIFTNIKSSSARVAWTKGNGSYTIILVSISSIPANPLTDGKIYTSSTVYTSAPLVNGCRCMYVSTSNVVNISGLAKKTLYYVKAFSYNRLTAAVSYIYLQQDGINNPSYFTTS